MPKQDESTWEQWWPAALGGAVGLALVVIFFPRRASTVTYYAGPVVPGGSVLSRFGPRTKNGETKMHWGVDLQAPRGTPVYAAGAGVVMALWPDNAVHGYGNTVILKHGEGEGTLYAHLDTIDPSLRVGERVAAGQPIGTVGCTDSEGGFPCSGAHLHLEVLAPPAGDDRGFTHVQGGENARPPRYEPQEWASHRRIQLV